MSAQDPIADMLTRIRNAQAVHKAQVSFAYSNFKQAICELLKAEGYINDVSKQSLEGSKANLVVSLKYDAENQPVIAQLDRVSRPSLRVYRDKDNLPQVKSGLGVAIISTSNGVFSDRKAKAQGLGGEVVCYVS